MATAPRYSDRLRQQSPYGSGYLTNYSQQNQMQQQQMQGFQMDPSMVNTGMAQPTWGATLNQGGYNNPLTNAGHTPQTGNGFLSRLGSFFGGSEGQSGTGGQATGFGGMGAAGWGGVIQGVGMLGSAWLGMQQLKQGKKEFKFNKGLAERNLANSASLINTNVARRAESNAASLGLQGAEADAYVANRKNTESVRGTI